MNTKKCLWAAGLVCLVILSFSVPVFAAETLNGGYLAGYENTDPRPSTISWWSTFAYLISLLAVFAFVVFLAYLASRFLGGKFARGVMTAGDGGRVLAHLPLGPNRSVCVVEIAERVFMLGVSEHSITLLREITDSDEIERLHRRKLSSTNEDDPFAEQFTSLQQLAKRIPSLFKSVSHHK